MPSLKKNYLILTFGKYHVHEKHTNQTKCICVLICNSISYHNKFTERQLTFCLCRVMFPIFASLFDFFHIFYFNTYLICFSLTFSSFKFSLKFGHVFNICSLYEVIHKKAGKIT